MTKADVLDAMTQFIGDDVALKEEIYQDYRREALQMLEQAERMIQSENFTELRRLAHTLKGCSANVGAEPLRALSYDWQLAAEKKDAVEGKRIFKALQEEMATLEP